MNWQRLLYPESIALVGASDNTATSRNIYQNLQRNGFSGRIVPVNPRRETVFGVPAYRSLAHAPKVDVAVLLLSRDLVEPAVDEAVASGVGGVIVVAGGFRESGQKEWVDAERRIAARCAGAGVPLIGPNCLGVMAMPNGAAMTIGPQPTPIVKGSIAFVMQSGGQMSAACSYANYLGGGVRWAFSLGNAAAVGFAEVIEALANDTETRELVLFIEEIPDWSRFRTAVAAATSAGKWIGAISVGRSAAGKRAALAHTGSLATDHEIMRAGLRQLGIHQAETLGALVSAAVMHARLGPAGHGGLGVVGVSGGAAGIAADLAHATGLRLAELGEETRHQIADINPEVRPNNPLDIVGGPLDRERFRAVLERFLSDPDVGVSLYLPSQGIPSEATPEHLDVLMNVLSAAEATRRPLILSQLVFMPIPERQRELILRCATVCISPTAQDALEGIRVWRGGAAEAPAVEAEVPSDRVQPVNEHELKVMLGARGCAVPKAVFVPWAEAAPAAEGSAAAAAQALAVTVDAMPAPFVVKGISRTIQHKAAAGLMRMDVRASADVPDVLRSFAATGRALDGVLLEEQVPAGIDLLASAIRDRLGVTVVISEGGGSAGARGHVTWMAIEPTDEELHAGVRGMLVKLGLTHPADGVARLTRQLIELLRERGFDLLEINPVRLLPTGEAVVLDAIAL